MKNLSGTENTREALNTAVVDAIGRVNDLNQLAANIAVAANLMSEAVQEIENELMEIISRLNQHADDPYVIGIKPSPVQNSGPKRSHCSSLTAPQGNCHQNGDDREEDARKR